MKLTFTRGIVISFLTLTSSAFASPSSPKGMERTYEQNYKDMVLATCLANAYKDESTTAVDAGSSVSALRDWTYYDLEKSPDAVKALIEKYLANDYTNPLVEAEVKGVKFDLLKCLGLYHSGELDALTKKVVIHPNHTNVQDHKW